MKIICATDFSGPARAGVELSGRLAAALGDEVVLLHAVEPPVLLGEDTPSQGESWTVAHRERAEQELGLARETMRAAGVTAESRVVIDRPADAIVELAHEADVRLVVLGSHGRKGAAHLFFGSVAEEVARTARVPVLVTRGLPFPHPGLSGERRLHLVVLVHGTPAADAALGWVKGFRAEVDCDVTFVQPYGPSIAKERFGLHVEEERAHPQGPPELRPLLERELRRWVGQLPGEGQVNFRLRDTHGHLLEDLESEAELLEPDLVVVGLATTRFHHAQHGPTAHQALRTFKLPILCIPETLQPPINGRIPVIRTVIVGTDLSDFANQAIPAACSLLSGGGGTLEICCVQPALGVPPPLVEPNAKERLEAKLSALVPPEAARLGITTRVAAIEAPSVTEGLMREAQRIGGDVVVVASHGRTGLKRAIMGSVAEELVRKSTLPVMVLYPPLR
jgi:nucleotide-binding universal stress UspA family protein